MPALPGPFGTMGAVRTMATVTWRIVNRPLLDYLYMLWLRPGCRVCPSLACTICFTLAARVRQGIGNFEHELDALLSALGRWRCYRAGGDSCKPVTGRGLQPVRRVAKP